MRRLLVVALVLLWLSVISVGGAEPVVPVPAAEGAPRPNIVVILVDDMGFSDIGCYGSEIATPNLDRLANEGLRYTQFHNYPRCCPSRAALLTGLYPHQAGIGDMVDDYAAGARAKLASPAYQDQLNRQCVTLGEALHAGGYATYTVGKWHVGQEREAWPDRRGFDRSFTLLAGASNYFGHGPQHNELTVMPWEQDGKAYTPPVEGFFTTDAFTDHAVELVRGHPADRPFFLYLAYNAPHWPLQELPQNIAAYRGKYLAGWDALREQRCAKQKRVLGIDWALSPMDRAIKSWDALPPKQKETWDLRMATYAAQITHMDQGVGRVMDALREAGVDSNTLVLFLSDNGACAEDINRNPEAVLGTRQSFQSYRQAWANVSDTPLRKFKHWTNEGGISTPLIARWPERIKPGGMTNEVGSILDFMPTFLQLAGAEYPKTFAGNPILPMEGASLVPSFQGGKMPARTLYWEHEGHRAVLDEETKLVAGFRGPWELYDMTRDRSEMHNLAAAEPERVKALAAKYEAWAARVGAKPWELTEGK